METAMATIKLHRCPFTFLHSDLDACWKVQRALDEQGIDYEIIKEPMLPRSRRKEVERLSGQRLLPIIEFDGGGAYRAESLQMADTILAGRLFEQNAGCHRNRSDACQPRTPARGHFN
jgi:glutathione S-transferase